MVRNSLHLDGETRDGGDPALDVDASKIGEAGGGGGGAGGEMGAFHRECLMNRENPYNCSFQPERVGEFRIKYTLW